jgi:lysophospholipase L1-like esterase
MSKRHSILQQASPSRTDSDRRRFIASLGVTACGLAASGVFAQEVAAADSKATPKRKGPAPTSGMGGIKELLTRKEPVAWVFTGDDAIHGAQHTKGWRSYPELFSERIRWELKRMRDVVINTGVSGDNTDGVLADLDWRVLHFQPDVVSLMVGMNDCKLGAVGRELFRKKLGTLVSRIMAAGAIPLLNTPNTIYLKNSPSHGDIAAFAQIIRDVAKASKAALVDHYADWEAAKPDQEDLLKWLDDQSTHPNFLGHREMAKLLFRELEIFDENSPTCKLESP